MKTTLALLIFLFVLPVKSEAEVPRLSLLTCETGDELYSTFGHSALRVFYPENGADIVFNFGLFDFNTPNFYSKFIRGRLEYMLGIQSMDGFLAQYKWEGRGVVEQSLNLTDNQIVAIMEQLEYLYLPKNRYYLYSFLYKNCTSELRDLIYPHLEKTKELKTTSAATTDRELINSYISGWTKFGINLILGSTLDKDIDLYQTMFLPDNLFDITAVVSNGDVPLVGSETVLVPYSEKSNPSVISAFFSPVLVLLLLSVLMVLIHFKWKKFAVADNVYIGAIAFLGIVLSGIILITEHRELYRNFNLLWCNPLFALLVVSSLKGWKKTERALSVLSLISLIAVFIVWLLGVQYAEPGFIIIAFTLFFLCVMRIIKRYG